MHKVGRCIRCGKKLKGRQRQFCRRNCKNNYHVTLWRRRMKKSAIEFLGGKCIECGYKKCDRALGFHHRDPSRKDFQIGSGAPKAWSRIVKELKKCDLLCANCHLEKHDELEKLAT